MLHNEARKLLVEGYEATHDAEGIAMAYVSEYIDGIPVGETETRNRKCRAAD